MQTSTVTLLVITALLWGNIEAFSDAAVDCCLTTKDTRIPIQIVASYFHQTADSGCAIAATVCIGRLAEVVQFFFFKTFLAPDNENLPWFRFPALQMGEAQADLALDCCLAVSHKAIPRQILLTYRKQFKGDGCPRDAVIFVTRKGLRLCAPPVTGEQWVKENIKFLDTRLKKCKETKFHVCNLPQLYHIFSHSIVVLVPQLSSIVLDDIKLVAQQACHCYCTSPAAGHFLFSGFRLTHDFVYIVDHNLNVKVLLMQNHRLLNYETTCKNILLQQRK
ncbi:C-C motif chemokine 19 [Anabarilius grahami]|uniref:C-C motif chemokine n=1 Tax=Anabarilius grahami TaxID=495550 RepID=A0A3N0XH62_ANAGA|nr:C-C motif chemokine 19 [Anabarilius grahami]